MIRTVAGLLDSLKHREMEIIARSGISHAPTIGAQYEGLTSDLLRRMIPEHLGLRVVSGFVEGHDGTLSGQIDCMLVYGTGTPVHQTALFTWPIRQVIALFEVKKKCAAKASATSRLRVHTEVSFAPVTCLSPAAKRLAESPPPITPHVTTPGIPAPR